MMKINGKIICRFFSCLLFLCGAGVLLLWLKIVLWSSYLQEYHAAKHVRDYRNSWTPDSPDELRRVCHRNLRWPGGSDCYAAEELLFIGNKESVPLLIRELGRQQKRLTRRWDEGDVLTKEISEKALKNITGLNDTCFSSEDWRKWWKKEGKKLSSEHFYPRQKEN